MNDLENGQTVEISVESGDWLLALKVSQHRPGQGRPVSLCVQGIFMQGTT